MKQLITVKSVVGNDESKKVSFVIEMDMVLFDKFMSRNSVSLPELDPDEVIETEDINHPLVIMWNESKHERLNYVQSVDARRAQKIRSAMRTEPDMNKWMDALKIVNETKWMHGYNVKRWKANFDWFIGGNKINQILSGGVNSSRWQTKK